MIERQVLRSREELNTLQPHWNNLVKESHHGRVFLTWEWLSAWVDCYLSSQPCLVIAVFADSSLKAIAPFWIDRNRNRSILRFLGSGEVCSDYLDFIVHHDHAPTWIAEIWAELTGPLDHEWDVIEYSDSPIDSTVRAEVLRLAATAGRPRHHLVTGETACPFLELPAAENKLLAGFSQSRRYAISYSRKHIAKQGPIRFELCTDSELLPGEMDRLGELHTRNWRARGELGAFASDRQKCLNLKAAQNLLSAGRLIFYSLHAGDNYLGTFYGLLFKETLYFYIMSVELSSQSRVNAGDVLLAECMAEAIRRGCREFDFLRGREPYKYRWTQREHGLVTCRIYNRSLRAGIQWMLDLANGGLRRAIRAGIRSIKAIVAHMKQNWN